MHRSCLAYDRMCTKIIALRKDEIGGQTLQPISIENRHHGNSQFNGYFHHIALRRMISKNYIAKDIVQYSEMGFSAEAHATKQAAEGMTVQTPGSGGGTAVMDAIINYLGGLVQ